MSITTGHTFWASPNPVMDQQLEVLKTESVIIKEVAEKSDCVIVGRCADYVLRDEEPFRIFLYAELEFKMKRCRERGDDAKKMSDRELQRHMAQIDKKRAEYYAFLSGQKWGAKENYDLCINTSTADEDKIVNSIAELYR
jgi:cytidylate kinase